MKRFSVINYKLVFIRVCKLPRVFDIDFFICFQKQARCKGYCKAQSRLNSSAILEFLISNMKGYAVFYLRLNYHEHKIFGPPYFCVFRVIHEPFLKIVFNTVIILF